MSCNTNYGEGHCSASDISSLIKNNQEAACKVMCAYGKGLLDMANLANDVRMNIFNAYMSGFGYFPKNCYQQQCHRNESCGTDACTQVRDLMAMQNCCFNKAAKEFMSNLAKHCCYEQDCCSSDHSWGNKCSDSGFNKCSDSGFPEYDGHYGKGSCSTSGVSSKCSTPASGKCSDKSTSCSSDITKDKK